MSDVIKSLQKDLQKYIQPERVENAGRFFKTGKGEYGEGDRFLGISNPDARKVAKKYKDVELNDVQMLLNSKYHEERFVALIILTEKYRTADDDLQDKIFNFYLLNTPNINNWDLVDVSAYKIVGKYLIDKKDRKILYSLSNSASLWERRIAIISTFEFIKNNDFKDSLKLARRLLHDEHDLIHKAVGWMLREIGKRDKKILDSFLQKHYTQMPRTMLRYAIEKHSEDERKKYI